MIPVKTTEEPGTQPSYKPSSQTSRQASLPAIAGGAVGGILVVVFVLIIVWIVMVKRRWDISRNRHFTQIIMIVSPYRKLGKFMQHNYDYMESSTNPGYTFPFFFFFYRVIHAYKLRFLVDFSFP